MADLIFDTANSLISAGADGVGLQHNNITRIIATADGADIISTGSFTVPTGTTAQEPTPANGMIRYDTDTNTFRGVVSSAWADLGGAGASALNDLTDVTLTAPATGAVLYKSAGNWLDTDALTIDPVGAVTLQFNTANKLVTTLEGVDVWGNSISGAQIGIKDNLGTTDLATIRYQTGLRLEPEVDSTGVSLWARNNVSTLQQVAQAATTGANTFFEARQNGVIKLNTTADGADILNGANLVRLDVLTTGVGVDANLNVRNGAGGLIIQTLATGANSRLRQTAANGLTLEDVWIQMNRNGSVELYNDGSPVFETTATGFVIDTVTNASIVLDTGGATSSLLNLFQSAGGVALLSNTTGATINQRSSTGVAEDTWIEFTRDGDVALFDNNVEQARTTTDALGGFEVAQNGFGFLPIAVAESSTFTVDYSTDFSGTVQATAEYTVFRSEGGTFVNIHIPNTTGTSNTTGFQSGATDVPANIRPLTGDDPTMIVVATDNGTRAFSRATIAVGQIEIFLGTATDAASWTASGTKAHDDIHFSYRIG